MTFQLMIRILAVSAIALNAVAGQAQNADPQVTLFTNVNVFDGVNPDIIKNASVVVTDNKITSVSAEPLAVTGGRVIDGKGRTLMPGLIEGHGHVMFASDLNRFLNQDEFEQGVNAARRANDYLMNGFTTIRDAGSNSFGLKRALDADIISGPRIYPSGASIGQTSGHGDFRSNVDGHPYFDGKENGGHVNQWKHTLIADGVDEVRRAVREQLFRGASQIKIHTGGGVTSFTDPLQAAQYTPEEIKAAVDEATRYGTYVMTHSQMNNSVVASLDAGVKSIEHGLVLEESTMKRMAKLGVFYSPQLFLPLQPTAGNPMFQDPIQQAKLKVVAEGTRDAIALAKKYKVKILWGTDVFFGSAPFNAFTQEFAYRDEFFTPTEQLQQITGNNGKVLALSGLKNPYPGAELGVIKEGAFADIIIVNGDPTKDIRLLMDAESNIDLIMKDGRIYKNAINEKVSHESQG
jgi:imidazolonepropionase-like amidohydrolase